MNYEDIWERQWQCWPCYGSPPGPQTEYECPNCLRKVTKEMCEDFHSRNNKDDIQKRMQHFLERMKG